MNNMLEFLAKSSDAVIALIGIIVSLFAIIGAFRAGVLKRVRFGSFELQASEKDTQEARALIHAVTTASGDKVPPLCQCN